jgi:peptidyl-dipeptidase A
MRIARRFALPAALLLATLAHAEDKPLTPEDAARFVARMDREFNESSIRANRAAWIYNTYITVDTEALAAEIDAEATDTGVRAALEAARFLDVPGIAEDVRRKLNIIRSSLFLPAPTTEGAAQELAQLSTRLTSLYARGHATLDGKALGLDEIFDRMETSRDPEELSELWASWHDNVGRPMKQDFARLVQIANLGAKELGYSDVGTLWRAGYDMPPADFAAETDRLWSEVKPLYDELHCYTRGKLNETYGDAVQPASGPIRADLLGDIWAQSWGGIYDMVAPAGAGDIGYRITDLLKEKGYDAVRIVKTAEAFFVSLGFDPLPATFWERSMLTKPADRDVSCHPVSWDIDNKDDVRIKMCITGTGGDFITAHHELGHNFYFLAYKDQDYIFTGGANDGFHEAVGDMLSLAITPDYLVEIGLLAPERVPGPDKDIGLLLKQAMNRVASLPYDLLIDKWRWGVFDGSIPPADYNTAWDRMRLDYQGIVPPVARDAGAFDPGGKYHVAATMPFMRYFLANVLMFQFYEAACEQAGWTGPLHRCSFYGNKQVGANFKKMLAMGMSKPWPDALQAFTGTRQISGAAILNYFAPLHAWLKAQNQGKACGW